MPWWNSSKPPSAAIAAWRASLAPGQPARVLAWASSVDEQTVVLSPVTLSVGDQNGWRHVGWHEIERGGWNAETEQLRWQTYAGGRGALALPAPRRVPEVFRERVAASLVFERFVPVTAGSDRGVIVSARRPCGTGAIAWHTTLTRGMTWRTPGVRALADDALARLRHEYDER